MSFVVVEMEKAEFKKLCSYDKKGELLFGKIRKMLRERGIDPDLGYQIETGDPVVITGRKKDG